MHEYIVGKSRTLKSLQCTFPRRSERVPHSSFSHNYVSPKTATKKTRRAIKPFCLSRASGHALPCSLPSKQQEEMVGQGFPFSGFSFLGLPRHLFEDMESSALT